MIRKVIDYIKDDKFEINIENNYLNIINYTNINYMSDEKIIIEYDLGILVVKGNNLSVIKLLNNEILVKGKLINIDFRGYNE